MTSEHSLRSGPMRGTYLLMLLNTDYPKTNKDFCVADKLLSTAWEAYGTSAFRTRSFGGRSFNFETCPNYTIIFRAKNYKFIVCLGTASELISLWSGHGSLSIALHSRCFMDRINYKSDCVFDGHGRQRPVGKRICGPSDLLSKMPSTPTELCQKS